jgi:Flp pilus assembly pilin Flp
MKKLVWKLKNVLESFKEDQQGIGVIEVVLILVVLIGLVLLFKNEISSIVSSAFDSIKLNSEAIVK